MRSLGRLLLRPILFRNGAFGLGPPPGAVEAALATKRKARLRIMRLDLCDLLELHPWARASLRHLWYIELTLERSGIEGLEALPTRVLRKGLTELERVVTDWSPAGLADLRSHLAILLKTAKPNKAPDVQRLAHVDDGGAEVREVSRQEFEQADHAWKEQPALPKRTQENGRTS